jgi:hypothetical protein
MMSGYCFPAEGPMKNYFIATLIVIIITLVSFILKNERIHGTRFPVNESKESTTKDKQVRIHLFIFFSKTNCHDCLEVTKVLNQLPDRFIVTGIVPPNELKDEMDLRNISGAAFPLESASKYKKFIPFYSPTIIGVSPKGTILFTLPAVPDQTEYLQKFLESLYWKLYPYYSHGKVNQ